MITKSILAEKFLRKLNGGDYTTASQVKKQDIYLAMEEAYGVVVQTYLNIEGQDNAGGFVSVYPVVPVVKDTVRDKFYSVLPAQLVSLKNGAGIRQISGTRDEYDVFIPQNSGDEGLFSGLESGHLTGKKAYWLELDRVYYKNLESYWEDETVMIKMIASIYSLPEDSFIPLPAGIETIFSDEVWKRIVPQKMMQQHKINDNTDIQP